MICPPLARLFVELEEKKMLQRYCAIIECVDRYGQAKKEFEIFSESEKSPSIGD
jgi:hypothetical protein